MPARTSPTRLPRSFSSEQIDRADADGEQEVDEDPGQRSREGVTEPDRATVVADDS